MPVRIVTRREPHNKGKPQYDREARLQEYVVTSSGCWKWQGGTIAQGYGVIYPFDKAVRVHRLAYEVAHGHPPKGMVCHHCDNPLCINPAHLYDGTGQTNSDDKVRRGRQAHVSGERNGRSKLTASQVREIRRLSADGVSRAALGRRFGVVPSAISMIVHRQHWKES
jgi:hypothetical protein